MPRATHIIVMRVCESTLLSSIISAQITKLKVHYNDYKTMLHDNNIRMISPDYRYNTGTVPCSVFRSGKCPGDTGLARLRPNWGDVCVTLSHCHSCSPCDMSQCEEEQTY